MIVALALAVSTATTYSPVSKWTLDYQQDLCLLTRPFKSDTVQATLGFRQAPADSQTEVIILFADDPDGDVRRSFVILKVAGSPNATLAGAASTRVPGGRQRLMRFLTSRNQVATLATASTVTIEEIGGRALTFALDKPGPAIRALDTCEYEQIVSWGVDPAQMAVPAKPVGDVASWFKFPLEAASNRRAGETTVRWMIDPTGKVQNCTVVRSSGTPILDNAACAKVSERGRYAPAVGKDGKPMQWAETRRIIWALAN